MIIPNVTYYDQESSTAEVEKKDEFDRETFLRLLLAQLSHQDPLNPMDSMEFTTQLSQFSELEQMISLNEKLDTLLEYQFSLNTWQGVSMIGKEVDASGDWVELKNGEVGTAGYHVASNLSQVNVQILDPTGRVVRILPQGPRGSGDHLIQWDGKDDNGATLPDGRYTVRVTGPDAGAEAVPTFVRGTITGLSFEDGTPSLRMGEETIAFASIIEIRTPSES